MIHEILSISFQILNEMPTEIKLLHHQNKQELVQKAYHVDKYKL
jgi:hypothetical protein